MTLPGIPHDKALHVIYGAAVACAGAALHTWWAGALLCTLVAWGWEAAQWLRRSGHASPADALATMAGGALVVLPWAVRAA
jgi:hypothetical protein